MKSMLRTFRLHGVLAIWGVLCVGSLPAQTLGDPSVVPAGLTAPLLLPVGAALPSGVSGPGIIDPQGGAVPIGFTILPSGNWTLSSNGGVLGTGILLGSGSVGGTLTLSGSSGSSTLGSMGSPSVAPPPAPLVVIGNAADNITPEITALAEALNKDVFQIFVWVRDNIAYNPYYGVKKGATLTLQERNGNDADTAALLVALLRAAGHNASYRYGTVEVPVYDVSGVDMASWLGVQPYEGLIDPVLTGRGMPASEIAKLRPGTATAAYDMGHWWVAVDSPVNGISTQLDPSFKRHVKVPGANVASLAELDVALMDAAGGTPTADYVQDLSTTGIASELTARAMSLVNAIKASSASNHDARQFTGYWKQLPGRMDTASPATYFPLSLSGSASTHAALHDSLFTVVQVQAGGINYSFRTAALNGGTLWIGFSWSGAAQLYLDDALLAEETTVSGSTLDYSLVIHHANGHGDQTSGTVVLPRVGVRTIVYGFDTSADQLRRHQHLMSRLQADRTQVGGVEAPGDSRKRENRLRAEVQNVMGLAWLLQTRLAAEMLEDMHDMSFGVVHRFGAVADEYDGVTDTGGYYIDVPVQTADTASRTVAAYGREHVLMAVWSNIASALEHGIIAQMQEGQPASSTTAVIEKNNDSSSGKTYLVNSTNWNAGMNIRSLVAASYSADDLDRLDDSIAANGAALVPSNGKTAVQEWQGAGYATISPSGTSTEYGMFISGGYKGGYVGITSSVNVTQAVANFMSSVNFSTPVTMSASTGADPIDMATGHYIRDDVDLVVGEGKLPRGITFGRHYNGKNANQNTDHIGYGWTHSLHIRALPTSDFSNALGQGSALQAAQMLLALEAVWQVYENHGDEPKGWAVSILAAKWAADQLTNNAVSIPLPDRIVQFQKLPDGSFLPPNGSTATLTKTGDHFVLTERHGNTWTFNADGNLATVTDLWNKTATFEYDDDKLLTRVTDCYDRFISLDYRPVRLSAIGIGSTTGKLIGHAYDSAGRGILFDYERDWRMPTGYTTVQLLGMSIRVPLPTVSAPGTLVCISIPREAVIADNDAETHFVYDSMRRMTHVEPQVSSSVVGVMGPFLPGDSQAPIVTRSQGRSVAINVEFDAQNRITKQITPDANNADDERVWKLYYGPDFTTEVNPLNERTIHWFDSRHRKIAQTDALGKTSRIEYDGQDHPVKSVSPLGYINQTLFDEANNPVESLDPLGKSSKAFYSNDGLHHLAATRDKNNRETLYADYNAQHQPQTITDPTGVVTTFTFVAAGPAAGRVETVRVNGVLKRTFYYEDAYGNLTRTTAGTGPEESTVQMAYNELGDLISITDALNRTTTFGYDWWRNKISTTSSGSLPSDPAVISTQRFNRHGSLMWASAPLGTRTYHTYNVSQKRLSSATFCYYPHYASSGYGSSVVSSILDDADRTIAVTDETGITATTIPDAVGRPWKIKDALQNTVETFYDDDGRAWKVRDPLNHDTTTTFNARGEAEFTTQADTHSIGSIFDNAGRQKYLTNRSGNTWTFTYDHAGRPLTIESPLNKVSETRYDTHGRLWKSFEPSGQETRLTYNSRDQVKRKEIYPNDTASEPDTAIDYGHDLNGNVLTVTEGSSVLTRTYDQRNAVKTYTDAAGKQFGYRYDPNGNLVQLTLPDNKTIQYAYDYRDRLFKITDWAGRITWVERDAAGRPLRINRPNGTHRLFAYDGAGRLIRMEDRKDGTNRLIEMIRLGLDAGGKIEKRFTVPLTKTATFPALNYTYNADNWINELQFDADGNLMQIPAVPSSTGSPAISQAAPGIASVGALDTNAVWDLRNRLQSVTLANGDTASYTYDAENLRITKIVNGQTTTYTHNPHGLSGMNEMTIEARPDGSTRWYVWGGPLGLLYDVTVASGSTAETVRHYHCDQVGSTLALTNASGEVLARQDYTAYGLVTSRTGTMDTPFLYNGAFGIMTDAETGLLHMRARYYHPWLARFLNADPSGFGGGMNFFGFANGDPVMLLDALGLDANSSWSWSNVFSNLGRAIAGVPAAMEGKWISTAIKQFQDPVHVLTSLMGGFGGGGLSSMNRALSVPAKIAKAADNLPPPSIVNSGGSSFAQASRRWTALDAYELSGIEASKIESHLRGIDFSKPVTMTTIPEGTTLAQFQLPNAPTGRYYALPGTPANTLGIYTSGLIERTQTFSAPTRALQSTAAPIIDNWSMSGAGWQIQTNGGGLQFFVPN